MNATATDDRKLMTLLVNPSERELLDKICKQDGGASRSAIVRKLIAQEAQRRNIQPNQTAMQLHSEQAA